MMIVLIISSGRGGEGERRNQGRADLMYSLLMDLLTNLGSDCTKATDMFSMDSDGHRPIDSSLVYEVCLTAVQRVSE